MAMSREEAQKFVDALKQGRRFSTRFQEEEWNLSYRKNGKFKRWSHREDPYDPSKSDTSTEIMSEQEVIELMMKRYNYDVMMSKTH